MSEKSMYAQIISTFSAIQVMFSFPEPKNPRTVEKIRQKKKQWKQKMKEKRARLVVHNLPFTSTEKNLREHFERFGEVADIQLLKKPDGKLVGCAFIQFKEVQKAHKAKHYTNGWPFLGRKITCDFAMAKDKYDTKLQTASEIKEEGVAVKAEVKEEPMDTYDGNVSTQIGDLLKIEKTEVKTEKASDEEEAPEADNKDESANQNAKISKNDEPKLAPDEEGEEQKEEEKEIIEEQKEEAEEEEGTDSEEEVEHRKEEEAKNEEPEDEMDEDTEEEEDEDDTEEEDEELVEEPKPDKTVQDIQKTPHVISNDVTEGKTVFIKNVPFSATNEDLKECVSQFGPLYYALVCMDKFTEHSKGTAFVKFRVCLFGVNFCKNNVCCIFQVSGRRREMSSSRDRVDTFGKYIGLPQGIEQK